MSQQTTSNIFMVRPSRFGYNEETAGNNAFQINDKSLTGVQIHEKAKIEFDEFVKRLKALGINVIVGNDEPLPYTPDAVFPNNWVTFHENGAVITYPMYAPKRRFERVERFLTEIGNDFYIENRIRLEEREEVGIFLEGTGSMILDRVHKIVYACLSPRTEKSLLEEWCTHTGYQAVVFHASDRGGVDIYHTNVMMALGDSFVIICLETIKKEDDLNLLKEKFKETNKEIIEISIAQMLSFAGNMLQVKNKKGATYLVMSEQAYQSLSDSQISKIKNHTKILYSPIPTIETYGGGSARCMMAEIFLKEK